LRVGISTASLFNRYELEDCPPHLAALGVGLCELFLNTFSEYREDFIGTLKRRLDENNLAVYSVHPMGTQYEPQLFSIHHRQREDALKIFTAVLAAARTLGARCYVMHGPSSLGGVAKNMEMTRLGPIAQELCELAASYGVTLAWENVSWCLFHTPEFGLRLLEATRADDLRFTLDVKQAARSGYSPLAFVDAVGERLVNLHLCDYRLLPDGRSVPMMPGQGECDFCALKRALLEKGYGGPAFLEVYSDMYKTEAELLESLLYIKNCFTLPGEA